MTEPIKELQRSIPTLTDNVEPQCFDLSLADSGGEEQGLDFPQIMSSLHAKWSRHALGDDLVHAWCCRRPDGSLDGFFEFSPKPWICVRDPETSHFYWFNSDTHEFFPRRSMSHKMIVKP